MLLTLCGLLLTLCGLLLRAGGCGTLYQATDDPVEFFWTVERLHFLDRHAHRRAECVLVVAPLDLLFRLGFRLGFQFRFRLWILGKDAELVDRRLFGDDVAFRLGRCLDRRCLLDWSLLNGSVLDGSINCFGCRVVFWHS